MFSLCFLRPEFVTLNQKGKENEDGKWSKIVMVFPIMYRFALSG